MKKSKIMLIITVVLCVSSLCYADSKVVGGYSKGKPRLSDFKFGSFGVSLRGLYSIPTGDIVNVLNGSIGPEILGTYRKFLIDDLDLELSGSLNTYTGKFDSTNTFQTINVKLLGRYNIKIEDLEGVFFINAGGGVSFEKLTVSSSSADNIDPIWSFGAGYEVALFDNITLQVNISYMLMPEKYIASAYRDGSFINFIIGLNYEFSD